MTDYCTKQNHRFLARNSEEDWAAARLAHEYVERGRTLWATWMHGWVRQLVRVPRSVLENYCERRRRHREHNELLGFDEHMLHDIGLTRLDIERVTAVDPGREGEPFGDDSLHRIHDIHLHR